MTVIKGGRVGWKAEKTCREELFVDALSERVLSCPTNEGLLSDEPKFCHLNFGTEF